MEEKEILEVGRRDKWEETIKCRISWNSGPKRLGKGGAWAGVHVFIRQIKPDVIIGGERPLWPGGQNLYAANTRGFIWCLKIKKDFYEMEVKIEEGTKLQKLT
jgi:hypothetical protein